MATTLFDAAAEGLEEHTQFDRLEARGTLRIVLKESGLEVDKITFGELKVVFAKLMPPELEMRAVADAVSVCEAVISRLSSMDQAAVGKSTDEIFGRLGGD